MIPLTRNPEALSDQEFDLLIGGGGIFGVCAAWDAALRGLSVAIVEKKDFASPVSQESSNLELHHAVHAVRHALIFLLKALQCQSARILPESRILDEGIQQLKQ